MSAADLLTVSVVVVLVTAAIVLGLYYLASGVPIKATAAPLYGRWSPRVGPGTVFAILLAVAVVASGPTLAARLRWWAALVAGYAGAVAWTFALAMIDGWERGLSSRLESKFEYLHEVPGVTDIPRMIDTFADRILRWQSDSWTVHVSGHPPGALLVFVWLDRIGLAGGSAAATVTILAGGLIAVAVPVTLKALGNADAARTMLPFAVLFPGAIWIGVSADGLFAGVMAVGIAVLAVAAGRPPSAESRRVAAVLGACAGVILGFGIFLSYGFVLFGPLALAIVVYRRAWLTLALAVAGALAVVVAFAAMGFWWLDGYHLVVERYYQDLGATRPYHYWVWANLASLSIMTGFAVAVGLRRVLAAAVRKRFDVVMLLVGGALVAILAADLSGLSKAETERIWLPFAVWLLPAVALLPEPSRRWWLAVQACGALVVAHLAKTVS